MKISIEGGKPAGAWCSWNESIGTGNGRNTEFLLPFPAEKARGLLVASDYETVQPDGRFREVDGDGKVLRDEPDGWTIVAGTEPNDLGRIVFQRARRVGAHISVAVLDRNLGGDRTDGSASFKILAMDDDLEKKFDEKMPPEMKRRKREDLVKFPPAQEFCQLVFGELVTDWMGVTDGKGEPLPCDVGNKKLFLRKTSALEFGFFALERARALYRERKSGFEAEVQD